MRKKIAWELYGFPAFSLCILFFGGYILFQITELPRMRGKMQGEWTWSDRSLFEFQKMALRFRADSFFLMHRNVNPKNLTPLHPCAETDGQIFIAGEFRLLPKDTLFFAGDYTTSRFSRDSILLCKDTGFKTWTQSEAKGDSLCFKGGFFPRGVCFARETQGE